MTDNGHSDEEERGMILSRFSSDVVQQAIDAGILDEDLLDVEDPDERGDRYIKAYREIPRILDDREKIEEFINREKGYVPSFPWFWGEYYHVSMKGDKKIVKERKASQERERFKERIGSLIDTEGDYISLLNSILETGVEVRDLFEVSFPLRDGKLVYASTGTRYIFETGEDEWSRSLKVSSIFEHKTDRYERLFEIEGFVAFEDYYVGTPLEMGYKVFIARELLPLIYEVLDGTEEMKIHEERFVVSEEEMEKIPNVLSDTLNNHPQTNKMNLKIPQDPINVDIGWFEKYIGPFTDGNVSLNGDEISRKTKKMILKQGTAIASYLWKRNDWKEELKQTIEWPQFLKFCSKNYMIFLKWWEGEQDWDDSIQEFIDKLEQHYY